MPINSLTPAITRWSMSSSRSSTWFKLADSVFTSYLQHSNSMQAAIKCHLSMKLTPLENNLYFKSLSNYWHIIYSIHHFDVQQNSQECSYNGGISLASPSQCDVYKENQYILFTVLIWLSLEMNLINPERFKIATSLINLIFIKIYP